MTDTDTDELKKRINHPRGEPRLRGQALFDVLDDGVRWFDRAVQTLVPARHNPFSQTGAIAVISFIISAISGVLLLVWYRPTVHQAWESVVAIQSVWIGEFLRALHRYSSDVCIFFALIHALRLFFAGRFTGPRWLAWVTGVVLVATLWFIGWTGYFLVWDEPAQLVARGSAVFLDWLPIFAEPIERSFLADQLVVPMFFFAVFFIHMLLPLAMAAGLWLHVSRVQRADILPTRPVTIWTTAALVVMAVALPATLGDPANFQNAPDSLTIDIWYLAPLWLTDRLAAGMLWAIFAIGFGLLVAVPWLLSRGRTETASLNTTVCNGCTLCAQDCPYNAIVMVEREDDRRYDLQAKINPDMCVGCGICAGSCNPGGIGLDWLPIQAMRRRFDDWIDEFIEESDDSQGPVLAFVCSSSAGSRLEVDDETGECPELPGFRVVTVPCSGWVQPLTVERALRRGAAGVLVIGCSEAEPRFREGFEWTRRRMAGAREPKLRRDKLDASVVDQISYDRTQPDAFIERARAFRRRVTGEQPAPETDRAESAWSRARMMVGGAVVTAATAGVIAAGSMAPYPGPPAEEPELVVSVNHYGEQRGECGPLARDDRDEDERLDHMQQAAGDCDLRRAPVRVEVSVDGRVVDERLLEPRGIGGRGPAVSLDEYEIEPGDREVRVRLADEFEGDWRWDRSWKLEFRPGQRQVVLFDTGEEFRQFGS